MPRKEKPYVFHVTHTEVYDPALVEQGFRTWALYLAEHLRKHALDEAKDKIKGSA